MTRRRLSSEESSLWLHVTRSVAPFSKRRLVEVIGEDAAPAASAKPNPKILPKPVPMPPPPPARHPLRSEPPPLGRKAKRRLARGNDPIDGRLDLHGMTQDEAHRALLGYLRSAQAHGAKVVLVITGKGGTSAYEGRGVLRRQVPMWLRLPDFRELIAGFETASIGHGGEGALYVRIRRFRI